jgi:hypothetical protein
VYARHPQSGFAMLKLAIDIGQTSVAKHAAAKRPSMQPHNPSMDSFNSHRLGSAQGGVYIRSRLTRARTFPLRRALTCAAFAASTVQEVADVLPLVHDRAVGPRRSFRCRRSTPFDGVWNVTVLTKAGSCEPSALYPLMVIDGKVSAAGADVSGKVGKEGNVRVSLRGAYANGQLSGNAGSGKWSGASSGVACSGRWEASRQ